MTTAELKGKIIQDVVRVGQHMLIRFTDGSEIITHMLYDADGELVKIN